MHCASPSFDSGLRGHLPPLREAVNPLCMTASCGLVLGLSAGVGKNRAFVSLHLEQLVELIFPQVVVSALGNLSWGKNNPTGRPFRGACLTWCGLPV